MPGTAARSLGSAASTAARLPKRAIRVLASGFMSPAGCAPNSRNSITS